ncbi:MAG: DUF1294 domain-containing protein [Lachnospiraceae bacterium]|nr:DUF1294 domain-containing protein [Lachnospiraceae bacterium]
MIPIFVIYIAVMTLVGFAQMGVDKKRAIRNEWRIKERTLFFTAAAGGSIGSILGMRAFRHKTKHKSFRYGMPAILTVQIVIVAYAVCCICGWIA